MVIKMEILKEKMKCKCCNGTGTQMNQKTGFIEHCPCCLGTGKAKEDRKIYIMEE